MICGAKSDSALRSDDSQSTRWVTISRLPFLNSREISSASSGISSISRTLIWLSIGASRRRALRIRNPVEDRPVQSGVGDDIHEMGEVDRLHQVAVHAELVALHDVAF